MIPLNIPNYYYRSVSEHKRIDFSIIILNILYATLVIALSIVSSPYILFAFLVQIILISMYLSYNVRVNLNTEISDKMENRLLLSFSKYKITREGNIIQRINNDLTRKLEFIEMETLETTGVSTVLFNGNAYSSDQMIDFILMAKPSTIKINFNVEIPEVIEILLKERIRNQPPDFKLKLMDPSYTKYYTKNIINCSDFIEITINYKIESC